MRPKNLLALGVATCLIFYANPLSAESRQSECKCDFNTPEYTAECDCAFACAVAVQDGKHCNIVCDGSPSGVERGNYRVYGEPHIYLNDMRAISTRLMSAGFKAFDDWSFSKHSIPRLLRSAYIGSLFISSERKYEIDTFVEKIFSKFGNDVVTSFTKQYGKPFKKEFIDVGWIEASYKLIRMNLPKYKIRLLYVK